MMGVAAGHLHHAAQGYRRSATTLRHVVNAEPQFHQALHHAKEVHWQSPAGDACRSVIETFHHPAQWAAGEAESLAAEADLIASELEELAHQAQRLSEYVAVLGSLDLSALAADLGEQRLRRALDVAADAVSSTGPVVDYLTTHGGVSSVLQEAMNRVSGRSLWG